MDFNNDHTQRDQIKLPPQTQSPGGGLLPLHHGDDGGDVGEDGDHPGSAPPEFSPSNLQLQVFCFVVLCFCGAPFRRASGTIFIVVFRSRRRLGKKDRRQRSLEAQVDGSHVAKESGRVGPLNLALGSPFVRFLCSHALFLPKTDARKLLGHLDVVWVPETSKYRKQGFLPVQG